MEGLVGIQYVTRTRGATTVELTFLDPPAAVIDVLGYAVLNGLSLDIPAGLVSGSLTPFRVVPFDIDIENETREIEWDFGRKKMFQVVHRHITFHARVA